MKTRQDQIVCCALLCVACGIVDAMGYLRHGIFAANMTGNTVLLGISLSQMQWADAVDRATPLVVFFVGAMLARLLLTHTGRRPWIPLLLEAVLLILALALLPDSKWSLSLITFAMGVQATAVTQFAGVTLSTVVVTSTMARISEALADRLGFVRRQPPAAAAGSPALPLYLLTWVCYLAGALLAGIGGAQSVIAMMGAAAMVLAAAGMTRAA
ncbi:MAG TPA: YoaK family protein [Ramlibacter sp.]|nr:YoaK family protein [Ramlibacter sp.]